MVRSFLAPIPAAVYGSWKTNEKFNWYAVQKNQLTEAEQGEYQYLLESVRQQQKEKRHQEQQCVADESTAFFLQLPHDVQHMPYMVRKEVNGYGLGRSNQLIVVPIRDIDGNITSLQFISPNGSKWFQRGGRVSGCFHLIGVIADILYICEGYATGATIHQETGLPVAVAFFADNLKPVAIAIRKQYPNLHIIIAADNDRFTPGNPGISKGREAANSTGASLVYPVFPKGQAGTDFNDLALLERT
ncbi:toprim domain-containing protein [Endozoicomonas sp. GU-1]|uniref:toprim domain-containing protein n=1 Tax=Endozoicomonas sp. GU-1 TaxID=3009078 RepID=UPI0022B2DC1D|nr:toprim domain-containing protein [Endozoicomonas sp. GU-1]WBA87489.1 toprim domain-containing protein [Endozoicomonas sp. GU-1]